MHVFLLFRTGIQKPGVCMKFSSLLYVILHLVVHNATCMLSLFYSTLFVLHSSLYTQFYLLILFYFLIVVTVNNEEKHHYHYYLDLYITVHRLTHIIKVINLFNTT